MVVPPMPAPTSNTSPTKYYAMCDLIYCFQFAASAKRSNSPPRYALSVVTAKHPLNFTDKMDVVACGQHARCVTRGQNDESKHERDEKHLSEHQNEQAGCVGGPSGHGKWRQKTNSNNREQQPPHEDD